MRVLVTVLVFLPIFYGLPCSKPIDCEMCTRSNNLWCPIGETGQKCFSAGDKKNPCDPPAQNIKYPRHCPVPLKIEPYDEELAARLAVFSSLAYLNPEELSLYNAEMFLSSETVGNLRNFNYMVEAFITQKCYKETLCGAVLLRSDLDRKIVVAFRGSTDGQLLSQGWNALDQQPIYGLDEAKVNNFHLNAYGALYIGVRAELRKLLAKYTNYQVVMTGQSLGGALATLTAGQIVKNGVVQPPERILLYTFGSPRVGNAYFAHELDVTLHTSWRVTVHRDVVTVWPRRKNYYHIQREVFYRSKVRQRSAYEICGYGEDNLCSYKYNGYSLGIVKDTSKAEHNEYFVPDLPRYVSGTVRNKDQLLKIDNCYTDMSEYNLYTIPTGIICGKTDAAP